MGKNKLERFEENLTFPNLFQVSYEFLQQNTFHLRGKWNTDFFKNDNPIVLELGCGKGEYTVNLAKKYPNKNYRIVIFKEVSVPLSSQMKSILL